MAVSREFRQVGVVGLGYWGPNLARNFDRLPGAALRWICDESEQAREPSLPYRLVMATVRVPRSWRNVSIASRTARYCSAAWLVGSSRLTR